MKGLTVFLAMMSVMAGASGAFADCDPARWINFSNTGQALHLGENMYVMLNEGRVNSNGNVQIVTTTLLNQKDEICTVDIIWEISCERQEYSTLQIRSHYDKDWPTEKDSTVEGDKVWKRYNDNMPLGKAANHFCGRKNQLPQLSP
jgi:hypothetical protein